MGRGAIARRHGRGHRVERFLQRPAAVQHAEEQIEGGFAGWVGHAASGLGRLRRACNRGIGNVTDGAGNVGCVNRRFAVEGRRLDAYRGTFEVTGGTRGPRGGAARAGQEYPGGTPAPAAGTYETVNLFGRRTGHRIVAEQDDLLPALPRGFTWILLED